MKQVRVAILGCGRMGKRHAQTYKMHPNVKVAAFYDTQKSLAIDLASEYHAQAHYSLNSVIENPNIDAVSICTPNALHFEPLKIALKYGKHILVEKPIVTTLEHCKSITKIARKSSSKVMVGHTHRFFPCNTTLKAVLDSHQIGDPQIINTFDYIPGRNPGDTMPDWIKTKNLSGGGIFMTDLIHTVDKIQWWMNSPIEKVFVPMASDFITHRGLEDAGIALVWLKNGTVATCIHGCPSPGAADMSVRIMGTDGEISMRFAGDLEIYKDSVSSIDYKHRGDYLSQSSAAFSAEISEFISSITEDRQPAVNYRDGIRAVRVILALYQSLKTRRTVAIKN